METKFSLCDHQFMVHYHDSQDRNYDFIATSDRFFYYVDDYGSEIDSLDNKIKEFFCRKMLVYRRNQHDISNSSRAEIAKLPYIYQTLQQGQGIRFPITIDNHHLWCGYGRAAIVTRYFPDIKIPAVILADHPLPLSDRLTSIHDLLHKILGLGFWINKDVSDITFGFSIGERDRIMAYDYQHQGEIFDFRFCQQAGSPNRVWDRMVQILNSHDDITTRNCLQIMDQIIAETVPDLEPIRY